MDPSKYNANISFSFGSRGFKVGFTAEVNRRFNNFGTAAGIGVAYYSNFYNTGKKGVELRVSGKAGYHNDNYQAYLGTNQFIGFGQMTEFNQRTGMISYRGKKGFHALYENDGAPFYWGGDIKWLKWLGLGDGGDKYRTAAVSIGWGDFSLETRLFTGHRDLVAERKRREIMEEEGLSTKSYRSLNEHSTIGKFGEFYENMLAIEKGKRYRYGGLEVNYRGRSVGYDSEWVRHIFQNKLAHREISPQPMVEMLSNDWRPIYNQTSYPVGRPGTQFSLW
jgi:hypothetical protein